MKPSTGKAPSIKFLLAKDGEILVKVSDKDKDISVVRYAEGDKSYSYFNKGKKGIKIALNVKNEKSLKLKKGIYTFYAIDKKGNKITKRVVIK